VLVRDVVPTVHSLQKMTFRKAAPLLGNLYAPWLARRYWAGVTERLLALREQRPDHTCLVRYEDLTERPLEETARLFAFIGSEQISGVTSYSIDAAPAAGGRVRRTDPAPAPRSRLHQLICSTRNAAAQVRRRPPRGSEIPRVFPRCSAVKLTRPKTELPKPFAWTAERRRKDRDSEILPAPTLPT